MGGSNIRLYETLYFIHVSSLVMKKRFVKNICKQGSMAMLALLSLYSCKERDDYPSFDEPVEEVVDQDVLPEDNQKTALVERIMGKTNYIKTFQMDTTQSVAPGFEYYHLRFISKDDVPISLHIVEIDQTKAKATMQSLSPYNDYLYSAQLLPEMIEFNQQGASGNIIAAMSGDVATSNVPSGSYVKFGRVIKSSNDRTKPYLGVKKGSDKIEFFNTPDTLLYPKPPIDLTQVKHLIGGSNFLLYQGNQGTGSAPLAARGAIGISQDESKIYLVSVDGVLADYSVGITYDDLGTFMKALGCYTAMENGAGNTNSLAVVDILNPELAWIQKNRVSIFSGASNAIGFVVK